MTLEPGTSTMIRERSCSTTATLKFGNVVRCESEVCSSIIVAYVSRTRLITSGNIPLKCSGAAAVIRGDFMYVYGGTKIQILHCHLLVYQSNFLAANVFANSRLPIYH